MDGDLKFSGVTPEDFKLGSLQVFEIYKGATLVWPHNTPEFFLSNESCCAEAPLPIFNLINDACCA